MLLILLLGLTGLTVRSQVTFRITSLPEDHPAEDSIYVTGNFNGWNPADERFRLSENLNITIEPTEKLEFKFTRGSWATVECDSSGSDISNRLYDPNQSKIVDVSIRGWKDLRAKVEPRLSTKAENVVIIDDFVIPQLSRRRRLWIYLPPDYHASSNSYPVIYMQDGQNLFDAITSFSGEWKVDESMDKLYREKGFGAIVVGIDNGGAHRIAEYSPWINTEYGGGEGTDYAAFLIKTLKPFIDTNYRTKPDPANTAIIGSSLGALISMYTALSYPLVFSKVGALSPAFWFNPEIQSFASSSENYEVRIFMSAGGNEPGYVQVDMSSVKNSLGSAGYDTTLIRTQVYPGMGHNEAFWAATFPEVIEWLFRL